MLEALEFYGKGFRALLGLAVTRTSQQIQAAQHRWTYQETANPKKVVVIGGSYAGAYLAQRLSETLPTGYKVVLIEKNTHFNHLFVFPRFGVVPRKEHLAFIPYDGLPSLGPPGIFEHIHGTATSIEKDSIQLASGDRVDYEYLALATGTWQPPPSKASSTDRDEACVELRTSQLQIQKAGKIAVIGGGPVGVQIATDIASFFPEKNVSLIHSRRQLLPNFGPKLHDYTVSIMRDLNINVITGERPNEVKSSNEEEGKKVLAFKDGSQVEFDLVIRCTGQIPNSSLLKTFAPSAIDPRTQRILVHPSLQILDSLNSKPRVFALGDVAETHGPHMARTARLQADIVTTNILAMLKNQAPPAAYAPQIWEGIIKLTLGRGKNTWYGRDGNGKEILVPGMEKDLDLHVGRAWENLGVRLDYERL